MTEKDAELIQATRFFIDKEVDDYGHHYDLEDIEIYDDILTAYVKFDTDRWGLEVRVSEVRKDNDGYDGKFEVCIYDDHYEESNWWDWTSKHFWIACLS